MSDDQLLYILDAHILDLPTLHNRVKTKGNPFVSSILDGYLDVGDTVIFTHSVNIPRLPLVKSNIGTILRVETQTNLDSGHIPYCCDRNIFPLDTQWIEVNWWIPALQIYSLPDPHAHVRLPTELIHTNFIQWIPPFYIKQICFIFHIDNIIHGT